MENPLNGFNRLDTVEERIRKLEVTFENYPERNTERQKDCKYETKVKRNRG